jgi:lipopolysaccharide transport system ATP-binding protein
MANGMPVIQAEGISKRYRIGSFDERSETVLGSVAQLLTTPYRNFKKYRGLYKFKDGNESAGGSYDDVIWALRDVSFNVNEGELVAIIGGNGAGKSTLLKILSRITTPTSGRVRIRGRVSSLLEVGTGFHQELTGRENIYLNGTILGMRKSEIDMRFEEIVEFSEIGKFLDTPVKRYSSGMRVRLAFSVAAHLEPDILIIDEVLAVGDVQFQRKCLNRMESAGSQGRTVLFVSHNMPAVTRLCSRGILLQGGRIVNDGPIEEVVGKHLGGGLGMVPSREWPQLDEAPGGAIARLRGVRLHQLSGATSEVFDVSESLGVEIRFDILESGSVLLPHFVVHNEEGVKLFVSLELDPEWKNRKRSAGHYVSTAWIPPNLLTEGSISLSPAMSTLSPERTEFFMPDAVGCHIVDGGLGNSARSDYMGKIRGVIRPKLEWRTVRRDANSWDVHADAPSGPTVAGIE